MAHLRSTSRDLGLGTPTERLKDYAPVKLLPLPLL